MGPHDESLLVGRAALLTSLRRQVDTATVGQGGLVLLAGEPGIGKTALAAEVLGYARSLGAAVAWGSCEDGGTAPGLWPWQQILRSVTGRPEPLGDGDGTPARGGAEDSRPALFEGVAERLLDAGRPLVAVLDDLQWADTASVLLLGHLGRRARHEPLLLLGTYRDVELASDHPLLSLPDADVVVLGGLPLADVAVLLDRWGEQTGAETAAAVQRRTGGNPFFVQQIARLRAAGGDGGAVPVAVGQTVARRLARLPDRTARLLGTAPLIVLGDRLGLFRTLAGAGPLTSAELAARTSLVERYVREWLRGVAVAGYLDHDAATDRFTLTDAYAAVLADDVIGVFPGLQALWADLDHVEEFFRTGGGTGGGDHHPALGAAQERFTRPVYLRGLIAEWIPAVDGIVPKLEAGATVAGLTRVRRIAQDSAPLDIILEARP